MTIITRASKGSDLTADEADGDIIDLDTRLTAVEGALPSAARGISSITSTGSIITITYTDATTDTIAQPTPKLNFTNPPDGAWLPSTDYFLNDVVTNNGSVYVVIFDHTSGLTFDPAANDGMGHSYYGLMLTTASAAIPTGGAVRSNLKKSSGANYALTWGFDDAVDVTFTPSTGSGLVSDNVADALDELAVLVHTDFTSLATSDLTDVLYATGDPVSGELFSFVGGHWTAIPQADLSISFTQMSDSLSVTQRRNPTVTTLGTTGTVSLDPTLGDVFTITPTGSVTLNAASAPAGAEITVIVTTSGTSSYNVTPTTNFKSQGVLVTGVLSAKTYSIKFVGDGTNLVEVSRTVAM